MPARPEIFISATTKDLKSCRQLVRDALLTLGCVPVVQDHFAPGAATVRGMLRGRIARCDAVIHLAGSCYGFEPQGRAPDEPRRSYAQMEYDIALELQKPLYTFVCASDFPYDAHEPEDDERRALQERHRAALAGGDRLFLPVRNAHDLEKSVRELRFQVRSWVGRLAAVAAAALGLVGALLWYLDHRMTAAEGSKAVLQQQNDALTRRIASLEAKLDEKTPTAQQILATVRHNASEGKAERKSDPVADAQAQVAAERGIGVEELQQQLAGETTDVQTLLVQIERESIAAQARADQWRKLRREALTRLGDVEVAAGHYREAVEPFKQAFAFCDESREPLVWCDAAEKLEVALRRMGRYSEAEPLARRLVERRTVVQGAEHPGTLGSVNSLANLLYAESHYAEAETLFRHCLEIRERTLGRDHPDTLQSAHNLAGILEDQQDYAGAEALYKRCVEVYGRTLGEDHPGTLHSVLGLANVVEARGDLTGAETLYRRCAEGYRRALGEEHPDTLGSIVSLASVLYSEDNNAEAEKLYRHCFEVQARTLGKDHPDTLRTISYLADVLYAENNLPEAESLGRTALEARERVLGREHSATLASAFSLANILYSKGDLAGAEALYRRCLEARERTLGREHSVTLRCVNNLANVLRDRGEWTEAEALYRRCLEARERTLGRDHPATAVTAFNFSLLQEKRQKPDEALKLAEEAVAVSHARLPENHPDRRRYEQQLAHMRSEIAAGKSDRQAPR